MIIRNKYSEPATISSMRYVTGKELLPYPSLALKIKLGMVFSSAAIVITINDTDLIKPRISSRVAPKNCWIWALKPVE